MSKYITLHETQAAYEAVKNALSKPQVAVIKENNDVHYGPLVKVNNVLLNKNELTLNQGATETLVATVLPVNASDKSVTWSSSDDSIATVNDSGVVTAVGGGNATITVTTVDGGYSAQCAVEVSDPYNGHDYVEIGGLKWATMNVGATAVTDNGLYFQWGDSSGYTAAQVGYGSGKKYFGWEDYKYGNGSSSPGDTGMTKYNSTDGKTTLDAEDDGVAVNWGGKWRMPTTAEFAALGAAVNTTLTSNYKSTGVAGLVCTAKDGSGAELFFPAAGYCNNGSLSSVDSYGSCWSSSLVSSHIQRACSLSFDDVSMNWQNLTNSRRSGRSLRGVVGE